MKVAAMSLVVIFLYGSTVWGIFPNQVGVSWEGHAFGAIAGVAIALFYRKKGPQPAKLRYEIEEELGLEPEVEYWKTPQEQPPLQQPRIIINYTVVPKQPKIEKEDGKGSD